MSTPSPPFLSSESKEVAYLRPLRVILTQQRRQLLEAARSAHNAWKAGTPGSVAAEDRLALAPYLDRPWHGGMMEMAAYQVAARLAMADDYSKAFDRTMTSDELLPMSLFALGRCISEALAHANWVLAPGKTNDARIARAMALMIQREQEAGDTLAKASNHNQQKIEHLGSFRENTRKMMEQMQNEGAVFKFDKKNTDKIQNLTFKGSVANIAPKATDLMDSLSRGGAFAYSLASGGTHAKPWLLDGLKGTHWDIITSIMTPVIEHSSALSSNLLAYAGEDTGPVHAKLVQHRIAMDLH